MDTRPQFLIRSPPYNADHPVTCYNTCMFFRCAQNALYFKGKMAWCRLADDVCESVCPTCKFAQCVKDKLLPNGICGYSVKTRTLQLRPEELVQPIKVPGKLAQKIKETELL